MGIRWQQKITNKRVVGKADISDISWEIRRRRSNYLGHILGREGTKDCFTALGWARRSKSDTETKDYLEKNGCEREKQGRV